MKTKKRKEERGRERVGTGLDEETKGRERQRESRDWTGLEEDEGADFALKQSFRIEVVLTHAVYLYKSAFACFLPACLLDRKERVARVDGRTDQRVRADWGQEWRCSG
ncbi:unnamed protein product [Calypogeia fissa]